jgi:hypothetical protein
MLRAENGKGKDPAKMARQREQEMKQLKRRRRSALAPWWLPPDTPA